MQKRILYSQNFIKDQNLISNLISRSSITNIDLVLDIGAGEGIITDELVKLGCLVSAYEIGENLFLKLKEKYKTNNLVNLILGDFISSNLPNYPYKVFSNIPFNITASVIKKLTSSSNPSLDSYLVVQKESAFRFIVNQKNVKNSQISMLLKPWFEISITHTFNRNDFNPIPKVDCILLRIEKRKNPLIEIKDKKLYEELVIFTFNQFKPTIFKGLTKLIKRNNLIKLAKVCDINLKCKPSELNFENWLCIYEYLSKNISDEQWKLLNDFTIRYYKQEGKLEKINRTRRDKDWKNKK